MIFEAPLRLFHPLHDFAGGFARAAADPDTARHADFLDIGGATRMHRDDTVALLIFEEAVIGAPNRIGSQCRRSDRLEDRTGHPKARELAVKRELRPLVGDWPPGVGEPEIAEAEEPRDLALDVDIGEGITHVLIFGQRFAVAPGLAAIAQQVLPQPVAPDTSAAAVLQFEMS